MDDKRTLYNFIMCYIKEYPDEFLDFATQAIGTDPEFCDGLLTKSAEFPGSCSPIIARALKNGLAKEASRMFTAAVCNPAGKGKDLEKPINDILYHCSDRKELETMELFQRHILPIINKMENTRIKRLYPDFVESVNEYIRSVERSSEKYQ